MGSSDVKAAKIFKLMENREPLLGGLRGFA